MRELNFAHKLRMKLWLEHLRIKPDQVHDGVAAGYYWRHPPAGANISPYESSYLAGTTFGTIKYVTLDAALVDPA